MKNDYNYARPMVIHIDLNSCFATVEQQARPRLRGRPVAIVNRRTDTTMIVTASYEAKAMGVKLGMRLKDAKKLCPDLIGLESDPPKYRYVYHQLMRIMQDYSAHVRMKSIDEGVIDFAESTLAMQNRDLVDIGYEIKQRLWDEIGCVMDCNVGIATNRFLAKTAASLHKPNGLDVITGANLRDVLSTLELTDLTGIAGQFEKRLNAVGIFTPLQFLDADPVVLQKMVFKSIVGQEWHQRLRGWEVDKRDFPMRTAGRQYVLDGYKMPRAQVLQRLHHLCEETGAKVRSQGLVARGVSVHARSYSDTGRGWGGSYWHARSMAAVPFFSDQAIYEQAKKLFESAPVFVKEIGVSCYELSEPDESQLHLFGDELARDKSLTNAVDHINSRYGKRVVHSADTLSTKMVKEKIPFGSTRYM
jgi:DNA polymerase-4